MWKDIDEFPGYQVSDTGKVRSLDRFRKNGAGTRKCPSTILKPSVTTGGHLKVELYKDCKQISRTVHSLVAEAFIGSRPDGLVICHGAAGRLNNSLSNLRYATQSENIGVDRVRDGTINNGSANSGAKLTDSDIPIIRKLCETSKYSEVAKYFPVCARAIRLIMQGRKWAHITGVASDSEILEWRENHAAIRIQMQVRERVRDRV